MPYSTYLPEKMGSATVSPTGRFEAGSYQSFTVTYTAGYFGIDDSGSIKIVHRFASDMGRPQANDPQAPNYTTVEASNGAVLHVDYDTKDNIRPWDKTLYVKVVRGFLRQGDQITVRFGDRRQGSPGIRVQTFCEETFEFRVLTDAIATCDYAVLPEQPTIAIVPGPPVLFKAIMPTQQRLDTRFRLCLKGEDRWGNPSDLCDQTFALRANLPVERLPDTITFETGAFSRIVDNLIVEEAGDLVIELLDGEGVVAARSNPCRMIADAPLLPYWGDLHGQSEETVGTNSAREFYEFARDKAFLDICVHQGNDFEITNEFWATLNELSAEFTEDNRFVVFPGWEWSGNTGLGGDRNVLHMHEGRQIHRSSHALVEDLSDLDTDANSAAELFEALKGEDCTVFAHIGGRYADIKMAHDERLEKAVEVHSAWGTFEWLLTDGFPLGHRSGVVCNSDGHKGRPGASYPGAAMFGAYGGLTCFYAEELTRDGIFDSLRRRHHYGTTGIRLHLTVHAGFETGGTLFEQDPNAYPDSKTSGVNEVMMGDIVATGDNTAMVRINAVSPAPIERIEVRNGAETVQTLRPYGSEDLGRRFRVLWCGAEYRGRARQSIWTGSASFRGAAIERMEKINAWNHERLLEVKDGDTVVFDALTTGNYGGFDVWLKGADDAVLELRSNNGELTKPLPEIGIEDVVVDCGGLEKKFRIFRLPDENPHLQLSAEVPVPLNPAGDNPLWVCVTTEDGFQAWSSPIFVFNPSGQQ